MTRDEKIQAAKRAWDEAASARVVARRAWNEANRVYIETERAYKDAVNNAKDQS